MSHFTCANAKRYQEHWSCEALVQTKSDTPTYLERLCRDCLTVELADQLTATQEELKEAREVVTAYANGESFYGGKRARAFLAKYPKETT